MGAVLTRRCKHETKFIKGPSGALVEVIIFIPCFSSTFVTTTNLPFYVRVCVFTPSECGISRCCKHWLQQEEIQHLKHKVKRGLGGMTFSSSVLTVSVAALKVSIRLYSVFLFFFPQVFISFLNIHFNCNLQLRSHE